MKVLMFCVEPVHLSQILCPKLPVDFRTWGSEGSSEVLAVSVSRLK